MKLKLITVLALYTATACTSTDEQPVASAEEPVAAESAELSEKTDAPVDEAKPADEPAKDETAPADDTAAEQPKAEEAAAAPEVNQAESGAMYVSVSHLNVRSGPGMSHPVVEVITFNSPVQNLGIENAIWVKIAEGKYISNKFLSPSKLTEPMPVNMAQPVLSAPVESQVVTEEAPAATEEPVAEEATAEAAEQTTEESTEQQPPTE